jgi:radical SAM superfamily enzyme YgiQ (UPF0313 family)
VAVVVLLDASRMVAHLGGEPRPIGLGGLRTIEARLAGRDVGPLDVLVGAPVDGTGAPVDATGGPGGTEALADLVAALDARPGPDPTWPAAPPARDAPPVDPATVLQAPLPTPLLATGRGYLAWPARSAQPVLLGADEVGVLSCFATPVPPEALGPERQPGNPLLATAARRDAAVAALVGAGLLGTEVAVPYRATWDGGRADARRVHHRTRRLVRQGAAQLADRPPRDGRVPVFAVERSASTRPPLASGMLLAAVAAHEGGRLLEAYDPVPDWHLRPGTVRRALRDGPGVLLFSDYVWSTAENLAMSAKVRELSPASLIVHGGPDAPQYPGDRERFFAEHPSVDVIVHGEGEAAVVDLLDRLGGRLDGDRRALAEVPGITFRPSPGAPPVTTEPRPRLADLGALASPYLTGLFDAWRGAALMATLETNRGCPYGCTFCDWGSATQSRIRQFPLERVLAEIDWIAEAEVPWLYVADANFGILARDVEITEHIAARKASHGFPERVMVSYAKNTVKHLEPIVRLLIDAELDANANLSVQSFDPDVLRITRRKNLPADEFARLAARFRDAQLPVLSDVMVGLPGATIASTLTDLQGLVEHEVNANIHPTSLLPNSPMNEPGYRQEWQIEADADGIVRSTASYTRAERDEMDAIVAAFQAAETYGILRLPLRWLADRTGHREIDVLEQIRTAVAAEPGRFPLLSYVLERFLDATTPPTPWALVLDEAATVVDERFAIAPDDPVWQEVRRVQALALPARGRTFPEEVRVDHDVVAWWRDRAVARRSGASSPGSSSEAPTPDASPDLASYGPSRFEVEDPFDTCSTVGTRHPMTDYHSFELAWPMARHIAYRWLPD